MNNPTIDLDERQIVLTALEPTAPLSQLEAAADALRGLVERANTGDQQAYAAYQSIMYRDIHLGGRTVGDPKRQWLAQALYQAEERFIPEVADPGVFSPEQFKDLIDEEVSQRARLTHPMSAHLYQGTPTLAEIDLFLEHHWSRSALFYRLFGEFALRFIDFQDSTPLYENLFDESGNGDPEKAHPNLLRRLLLYRGLPAETDMMSDMPQEQAYLNNRIRCMRHPDLAWGLAVVYLIEDVTAANHRKIHQMLVKAGIPEEYREFHRLHGFVDEVHAAELWELVGRRAGSANFRKTFLRSVRQHFHVSRQYYDALWAEMRAIEA